MRRGAALTLTHTSPSPSTPLASTEGESGSSRQPEANLMVYCIAAMELNTNELVVALVVVR